MADYTGLTLASLLPGEPWTAGKALAVYENPTAIAEGAVGAPRVQAAAMAGSVAGDVLLFRALGLNVEFAVAANTTLIPPGALFRAVTACEVRVAGQVKIGAGGGASAQLRVFKNSTQVDIETGAGIFVDLGPVDISVVAGDVISFTLAGNSSGGIARNITFSTAAIRTVGGI